MQPVLFAAFEEAKQKLLQIMHTVWHLPSFYRNWLSYLLDTKNRVIFYSVYKDLSIILCSGGIHSANFIHKINSTLMVVSFPSNSKTVFDLMISKQTFQVKRGQWISTGYTGIERGLAITLTSIKAFKEGLLTKQCFVCIQSPFKMATLPYCWKVAYGEWEEAVFRLSGTSRHGIGVL